MSLRVTFAFLLAVSSPALASADPLNLNSQSGFLFDFWPSTSAYMSNGLGDAYDGCYSLTVNNTAFAAGGLYEDWYEARGFRTRAHDMGDLVVQRYGYVPEVGLSFARYIDVVENTGAGDILVTFSYYCNLGSDGWNEFIGSSDGDATAEITDTYLVTDDADNGGDPSLGHVFFGEGGDTALASVTYRPGDITWTYQITIPAGDQRAIMIFGIQEQTRVLAEAAAVSLVAMQEQALDAVGDEINDVANFPIGPADGPHLRANGPYRVDEGGSVQLGVEITDPNGDPVTWSWDMNADGTFGDSVNVLDPVIDASAADGPGTIRVGLQMSDGTHTVDRQISIAVTNVDPIVSSTPTTEATTNELYEYQIVADDVPADPLTYVLDEGPVGMTISVDGLVLWTPEADGRGPTVPVVVSVQDGDGGELEHVWEIEMYGGPIVVPGGPYRVAEGGMVALAPLITDPEGDPLTIAWDLDADGLYDDSDQQSVEWSAAGIDGPADGFIVRLLVTDGEYQIVADIPIEVTNAPPEFVSTPAPVAVVGREWVYVVLAIDPGGDVFDLSVDTEDLPLGMTWDPLTATLRWTPNAGDMIGGQPPGQYSFQVTAEDEDRGRSRQELTITVGENNPPPVPPIKYPNDEDVHTPQPTILLDNVVDPDGDAVSYFVEVDYDTCFCSVELQSSGALTQGELVTEWRLPRPLNVDPSAGGHVDFYTRRWASDGLAESSRELSLFHYAPVEPDGDADTDADADADGDADGDADTGDEKAGCACRTASPGRDGLGWLAIVGVAVLLCRRRRAGNRTT